MIHEESYTTMCLCDLPEKLIYDFFCLLFPDLQIRNNFRHYFLSSVPLKIAYDVVTWVVTQLAVCYTIAPFVMLAVEPTIKFYK